ncbi:MAG: DUF928 domain-containing protein, partial [Chroococcales cyanobacterium]
NLRGPRSTAGGGVRGNGNASCIEGESPLTPLVPTHDLVKTITNNPTFFLYVPKNSADSGEFVIVDEDGNDVYLSTFAVSEAPGVVKVNLPAHTDLEIGQVYDWQFSLICDQLDRKADIFVQGQIQPTELTEEMQTQLDQAQPLDQVQIYVNESLWNEAVSLLVQVRNSNPTEWQGLLKYVGLERIASEPLPLQTIGTSQN